MRHLNYPAVIDRVYRHFIVDRQPPGINGGVITYHADEDSDGMTADSPCAIGLFDTDRRLADPEVSDLLVEDIWSQDLCLLCEIFGVDDLTPEDAAFLKDLQGAHDSAANRYRSQKDRGLFVHDLNVNLGQVSYRHIVQPATA